MSARPDTWMPMYWGDYARDTGHLNAAGHGAYLMLIKHYWCTGLPLNDDDEELWRIACCDSKRDWQKLRPKIIRLFAADNELLRHKRIDKELAKASAMTDAKAEAGTKGAAARWGTGNSGDAEKRSARSQRLAEARARGAHTTAEWGALLDVLDHKCVQCGLHESALEGGGLCKDHIKPIYQGGSDAISNIQPMCRNCNSRKGSLSEDHRQNVCHDWRERLAKRLGEPSVLPSVCDRQTDTPSQPQSHSTASLRSAGRRSRVPADWWPDEKGVGFAQERSVDVDAEVPRFRDYHVSKGNLFADIGAAWRTWCQNQAKFSKPKVNGNGHDPLNGPWDDPAIVPCEGRPSVNGYYLDAVFAKCCERAGIDETKEPVTWKPIIGWLQDGIEPDAIYSAIRQCADRPGYSRPKSLRYFDAAVREAG